MRKATAPPEQQARAAAAVKRAPALFDKYSAGLDADQRAELKSFTITLDFRDATLADSEAKIKAKLEEIRLSTGFDVPDSISARTALLKGYVPAELQMLERVTDLYCKAAAAARSARPSMPSLRTGSCLAHRTYPKPTAAYLS